ATLYLPDVTVHYQRQSDFGQYGETFRDEHKLGVVPITPLVNRARLSDWLGRSEPSPHLPLAHPPHQITAAMMVAAEFVALPIRGVMGLSLSDFEDAQGNPLTALQVLLGRLLAIPDDDGQAKTFEFSSANLGNFHETLNQLARIVASIAGL